LDKGRKSVYWDTAVNAKISVLKGNETTKQWIELHNDELSC